MHPQGRPPAWCVGWRGAVVCVYNVGAGLLRIVRGHRIASGPAVGTVPQHLAEKMRCVQGEKEHSGGLS